MTVVLHGELVGRVGAIESSERVNVRTIEGIDPNFDHVAWPHTFLLLQKQVPHRHRAKAARWVRDDTLTAI